MPKSQKTTPKPEKEEPSQSHEDRVRELKDRVAEVTGVRPATFEHEENEELPPEIREQFWEHVLAFEEAPPVRPIDLLLEGGVELPPPDELDDGELRAKLWEMIRGMHFIGMYLLNTDHLSDRELYEILWEEQLHREMVLQPEDPDTRCFIDMVGTGSEEDVHLYLKHFAGERDRGWWAEHWDGEIPAHEDPPYDRDRYLPHPDRNPPEPGSEMPA